MFARKSARFAWLAASALRLAILERLLPRAFAPRDILQCATNHAPAGTFPKVGDRYRPAILCLAA